MSLYLDASALLKLYFEEPDTPVAEEILSSDREWITGRHTQVEVRRNLARQLTGEELRAARAQFDRDLRATFIVELTAEVCEAAAGIAEVTGARTLDALHLGAAKVVGGGSLPFVTFDLRQAQVARSLGWTVLGT
ncbi:MAG TPA: type II toxin-antitoxin system VapC family toxin [Actinomycetota bacterium]|nr:type II toxin-antitoxin system VapC family toxin [Actinomycetota bacterium]